MIVRDAGSKSYNLIVDASNQMAAYLILQAAWFHMWVNEDQAACDLLTDVRRDIAVNDMTATTLIHAQHLGDLLVSPRFHPSAYYDDFYPVEDNTPDDEFSGDRDLAIGERDDQVG